MGSMRDKLDAPDAEGWRPEIGDVVIGIVEEVATGHSDVNDKDYPIVIVEQEDGSRVAVHAFHSVLGREIESLAPSEGDEIGIKYEGQKEPKGGLKKGQSPFHAYRVKLSRNVPKGSTVPTAARASASVGGSFEGDEPDFGGEEPF